MKRILYYLLLLFSFQIAAQQSYYNDVDLYLTGGTLKDALATKIISTHTKFLFYSEVWEACKATDVNPTNATEVLLLYGWENGSDGDFKNDRTRGINNNGGSNGQWNREHVYSRSLGTPNLGESGPGSDAHHLRPTDVQTNSSRGNLKFTNSVGTAGSVNGGWYPGDEWKGDVARMMMYMYLRYGSRCLPTNVGFGSTANTQDEMIDLFLLWNAADPVSDVEKQRNEYHGNTNNTYAQGNRNPFIDNPRLATRIWGGPEAEDRWGIYSNNDTQAPTVPTNVTASNITTSSITLSWTASTDNVGVSSYDVFVNGNLYQNTTNTSINITGLNSNTSYNLSVLAKDVANNQSAQSTPIQVSTLQDTQAPSVPSNIVISNQTTNSFIVSWTASTDNTAVTLYDIFINNSLNGSTNQTTYTVTNLAEATTYSVQIAAKDAVGNTSALSTPVNATTTSSNALANELFFSEYVEGSSNNKALELVNITNAPINLSGYSIRRQRDGGQDGADWGVPLNLSGVVLKNDVYVIINGGATLQKLIDEADFVQPNASQTNFGEPLNYNGNDPVGLFKNGVLIDIIGTYNGGSANFAQNKTLRRKTTVSSPNSTFDIANEWDVYPEDTVSDIGTHSAIVLSTQSESLGDLQIFPNPASDVIYIKHSNATQINSVQIYSILGNMVSEQIKPTHIIGVQQLQTGFYLMRINTDTGFKNIKFIKF